ncbi:hypothetical protein BDR04DRAFT_1115944 [Suillus decipiens]|nr:hypothetical protein BDR04DRAFT_1115944 [Suillus decipiens]
MDNRSLEEDMFGARYMNFLTEEGEAGVTALSGLNKTGTATVGVAIEAWSLILKQFMSIWVSTGVLLWNQADLVVIASSGHLSLLLFPPPTMGKLKHLLQLNLSSLRLTHLQGLIGILDILMLEKVEQPFVIPDGELENIMVPSSEKKRTHKKGKKSAVPGVMTPDQLDDSGFASSLHIAEPGERFGLKKNPIPLSYDISKVDDRLNMVDDNKFSLSNDEMCTSPLETLGFFLDLWVKLLNYTKAYFRLHLAIADPFPACEKALSDTGICLEIITEFIVAWETQNCHLEAGFCPQYEYDMATVHIYNDSINFHSRIKQIAINVVPVEYKLSGSESKIKQKATLLLIATIVHNVLHVCSLYGHVNMKQTALGDSEKVYCKPTNMLNQVTDDEYHSEKLDEVLQSWALAGMTGVIVDNEPQDLESNSDWMVELD